MEILVAITVGVCLYNLSLSIGESMPVIIFIGPTPAFAYLLWNKLGQAYRALENSDLFDSDDKVYAVSDDKEAEILDQEEESVWGETTAYKKPGALKSGDPDAEDEGGIHADDEGSDSVDDFYYFNERLKQVHCVGTRRISKHSTSSYQCVPSSSS